MPDVQKGRSKSHIEKVLQCWLTISMCNLGRPFCTSPLHMGWDSCAGKAGLWGRGEKGMLPMGAPLARRQARGMKERPCQGPRHGTAARGGGGQRAWGRWAPPPGARRAGVFNPGPFQGPRHGTAAIAGPWPEGARRGGLSPDSFGDVRKGHPRTHIARSDAEMCERAA